MNTRDLIFIIALPYAFCKIFVEFLRYSQSLSQYFVFVAQFQNLSHTPQKNKKAPSACKISGKMKLATTIFVVAFDMQETKSSQ